VKHLKQICMPQICILYFYSNTLKENENLINYNWYLQFHVEFSNFRFF
jgi:hypothetical protein